MSKKDDNAKVTKKVTKTETYIKPRIVSDFITNNSTSIELNKKQKTELVLNKKVQLKCKNQRQKAFIQTIDDNFITLCSGSAGVGKSYLSVAKALQLIQDTSNLYENIYIITPAVESEEKLGSLPGNVDEKLAPYLFSTYYLIDKIIGKPAREQLVSKGIIQNLALAYLRGMNIDNAIVIAEECQNMTKKQMILLLSRLGTDTKMIISGDIDQIDRFRRSEDSGLIDAFKTYKDIEGVGMFSFSKDDIVRHPLISKLLERYDDIK